MGLFKAALALIKPHVKNILAFTERNLKMSEHTEKHFKASLRSSSMLCYVTSQNKECTTLKPEISHFKENI
jgi:hypothetical protein